MKRKEEWKDNLYIVLAFVVMGLLYYSTSMAYEEQNVQPFLLEWLSQEPLRDLFSGIRFTYAGSEVSVDALGYVGFVEFFIRKGAHFGSYFLLGSFWFLGLRHKVRSLPLAACLAVLLSFGYASFDELRQTFHPYRSGLMEDVILDTVGAIAGVLLFSLIGKRKGKKRNSYAIRWL
jgi:hypothetical protein